MRPSSSELSWNAKNSRSANEYCGIDRRRALNAQEPRRLSRKAVSSSDHKEFKEPTLGERQCLVTDGRK
jgi:hypothetical protein